MNSSLYNKLRQEGIFSEESWSRIQQKERDRLFSLHWELKTILYLGVLLATSGFGLLVYENIDSIGHQVLLWCIAILSAACFVYCFLRRNPFSITKVNSPGPFFDYTLLFACIMFVIFIGYWQYQYAIFGSKVGLATFVPLVVLFFASYFFDHLGILSLAITNLAAWAGIVVTPLHILKQNNFESSGVIFTGLLLGVLLLVTAFISGKSKFKEHFAFTYTNFGMHLVFISCLAGMFHFDSYYFLWLLLLAAISLYFYREAFTLRSFYYVFVLALYGYIGFSYMIIRLLFYTLHPYDGSIYFICLYFIGSGLALVLFLMKTNKKLKEV